MKNTSLKNHEIILAGIFGLAALGQFERFSTVVGQVSLHEIAILFFLATLLGPFFSNLLELYNSKQIVQREVVLAVLFTVWTLFVTGLNAIWLDLPLLLKTGGSYLARLTLYHAFFYGLHLSYSRQLIRKKIVEKIVLIWLLFMSATGIAQYLFIPDTRALLALGWDEHLNRALGTLLDPGFFGLLMAIGAIFSIGRWMKTSPNSRKQWIWPVIFSTFLLSLTLSFSRASYLAYIAGVLALAWIMKSRKALLFIPLLIMAIVLVPKDGGGEGQNLARTNSVAARAEVAQFHTEGITAKELFFGRGWYYESSRQLHRKGVERESGGDTTTDLSAPSHSQAVDNSFLHVFLSTGIVGFGIFLSFLVAVIRRLWPSPILAILTAVLVHSFFSTALFYPWVLLALVLLVPIQKAARD